MASISASLLLLASLSSHYYLHSGFVSLLPTFTNHPLSLLCASSSQYPPSLLFICSSFSALFTDLLSGCSPLFFSPSTLRPLTLHFFPVPFFSPPFSFHSSFSPSLWVSRLCGGSQSPSWTSSRGRRLKSEPWNKGRKGRPKGSEEDEEEEEQMEAVERNSTKNPSQQDSRGLYDGSSLDGSSIHGVKSSPSFFLLTICKMKVQTDCPSLLAAALTK